MKKRKTKDEFLCDAFDTWKDKPCNENCHCQYWSAQRRVKIQETE